jgi:Putative porin
MLGLKDLAGPRGAVLALAVAAAGATPAFADPPKLSEATAQIGQAPPAPSPNAMVNLVNLLVKQGALTRAQGDALIQQANEEAAVARQTQSAANAAQAAVTGAKPADGSIHVTYVPEIVKKQLREEVKQEVIAQAKQENWAQPNTFPDWVSRIKLYGDIRTRYEGDFFPSGNDTTGSLFNFNAINTGAPFDLANNNGLAPPAINADKNRNRFRLRARLGADADLGGGFDAGLRIATGETNTPVSQNQTLGAANNAQGGNFSNYAIWLDRGYIKYEPWNDEHKELAVQVGRFDNPFFSTNLIWADEIAFDGIAVQGRSRIQKNQNLFFTAGAFPVFNTDFNFASNQPSKFSSEDKWLFAAQGGADWKINQDFGLKAAAAFYYFRHVEGKLSSPCTPITASDNCNTDDTRPSFAQKGNTYMQLRDIVGVNANNGFANGGDFQYFGLAAQFHELALTGRFDVGTFDPTHIWIDTDYVKNLGFHRSEIFNIAFNNLSASTHDPNNSALLVPGHFNGGDTGYFVNFNIGNAELQKLWDWNFNVGYKHIQSDAVVDAFNDSDFGLGGTNLKGYIIGGKLALAPNIWTRLRWMSADSIAGPPFSVDVVQLDLNAKF